MILVLGGTADGRQAAELLAARGRAVIYSSVSGINAPEEGGCLRVHNGAMDQDGLTAFLKAEAITQCVDATHPYAAQVSRNAMAACAAADAAYIRLERPGMEALNVPEGTIRYFEDYEAMVDFLKDHDGPVLTTTGSRELGRYAGLDPERLYVRVLPTSGVLKKCEDLGYKPGRIIAIQGPFSREMNRIMMAEHGIRYITTKDSGDLGGVAEKVLAAADCGATVLCVRRPQLAYPTVCATPEEVLAVL